jgi:hypothetical protein
MASRFSCCWVTSTAAINGNPGNPDVDRVSFSFDFSHLLASLLLLAFLVLLTSLLLFALLLLLAFCCFQRPCRCSVFAVTYVTGVAYVSAVVDSQSYPTFDL